MILKKRNLTTPPYFAVIVLCAISCLFAGSLLDDEIVFYPQYSGIMYPKNTSELIGQIRSFLSQARAINTDTAPSILLVPAGSYLQIGGLIADAFKQVQSSNVELVLLLAPSWDDSSNGVSIFPGKFFRTPLGAMQINETIIDRLIQNDRNLFKLETMDFEGNFNIEVILPFLQYIFPDKDIVPIVLGNVSCDEFNRLSEIIDDITRDRKTLIIASANGRVSRTRTSMSSYFKELCVDFRECNAMSIFNRSCDGSTGVIGEKVIALAVDLANRQDANSVEIFRASNMSTLAGKSDRNTIYFAAGFYNRESEMGDIPAIDEDQMKYIGKYVVDQIRQKSGVEIKKSFIPREVLDKIIGVHLSVIKDGKTISSGAELFSPNPVREALRDVIEYAFFKDPVTGNCDLIKYDNSILRITVTGRPKRLVTGDEFPNNGLIYLKSGNFSSMSLLDFEDDRTSEIILRNLCLKAGLLYNCWRKDECEIYHFNTRNIEMRLEF